MAVEDTAAVAEARAAFMAYMIELMAEQNREGEEANVQVEKLEDEGAINLGQVLKDHSFSSYRTRLKGGS